MKLTINKTHVSTQLKQKDKKQTQETKHVK